MTRFFTLLFAFGVVLCAMATTSQTASAQWGYGAGYGYPQQGGYGAATIPSPQVAYDAWGRPIVVTPQYGYGGYGGMGYGGGVGLYGGVGCGGGRMDTGTALVLGFAIAAQNRQWNAGNNHHHHHHHQQWGNRTPQYVAPQPQRQYYRHHH